MLTIAGVNPITHIVLENNKRPRNNTNQKGSNIHVMMQFKAENISPKQSKALIDEAAM